MSRANKSDNKPIEQYDHKGKDRINNPPVGLVTPETDSDSGKKTYSYDPHLDPALVWAVKAERTSFEVPTVSLHVHERIDPRTIIEAVRRRNGADRQKSLFEYSDENPPLREAIEFYRGTISLPFEAGKNGRIAVKIVDDRGIESLKIVEVQ